MLWLSANRKICFERAVGRTLRDASDINDGIQAALFDPRKIAPEYPASQVLEPPSFNANYDFKDVKPLDGDEGRRELARLISEKRAWTRRHIAEAPEREIIVRYVRFSGLGL